ncbi:hypothetical protein BK135_10495 [Paenibacillus peoriae]|nr:hypothetical protein BK135_10495 [Paenibacillus peoriae]
MTEREYLFERLEDQINWYDKKSSDCQKKYKRLKWVEIGSAAAIPILSGFSSNLQVIAVIISLLGASIAIIESLLSLGKYHENWIEYRGISETLKQEKYMYLTRAGVYKISEPFELLVERIESIISKENINWANLNSKKQGEDKK